ncbi:MAG: hypothetical protein QW743_01065 [Candidatus Methanomethylicia archaeon]
MEGYMHLLSLYVNAHWGGLLRALRVAVKCDSRLGEFMGGLGVGVAIPFSIMAEQL